MSSCRRTWRWPPNHLDYEGEEISETESDTLQDGEILQQVERIRRGDVRSMARTLSRIENTRDDRVRSLLTHLYPHTGQALVVGITGSPGSGKSTLVDQLARLYKQSGKKVGIIAVDPTSPFSGGALLGDRVRMQALSTDPDIFIRSMATRGRMGGLSDAVGDALVVLEAGGYEVLIIETVGVGQDEVDIVRTAQVTVVVLVPGMGDEVQSIKAGIMEIGDVFVINKADRPDVSRAEQELRSALSLASRPDGWDPPIVKTVATKGDGTAELAEALASYSQFVATEGPARERQLELFRQRLVEMVRDNVAERVLSQIPRADLDRYAERLANRETDPYTLVDQLLEKSGLGKGPR